MRAIVVDDEPLTGEYIGRLLEEAGVEVIGCCADPREALELIDKHRPEALFLDIEMPEISGLSLAERIQAADYGGEVVFVTAYSDYALDAFRVNARDYLLKPVREQDMHRALERLRKRLTGGSAAAANRAEHKAEASFFGTFALRLGDNPAPVRWTTAKCAELFAFMLLQETEREVTKWTLIEALWKDKSAEKADVNLRSTVSRVNRTLRHCGSAMALVSVRNGGYRLDRAGTEITADAFRIESLALNAGAIGTDNAERLAQGMARCDRPFLENFDGEWCESYRMRYHRYLTDVGYRLLVFGEENGADPQRALGLADALLRLEPYAETIRAVALRLRERLGGRAQAISYYLDYAAMLHRELGAEPGEELQAIRRRLLGS